jgi:hypothetical protein
MLAHSPPFPLIIDYNDEHDVLTAEDEEAIVLAFGHRYRIRRIRLAMPVPNLQKLIVAMHEEYPVLEYFLLRPSKQDRTTLTFPNTSSPHAAWLRQSNRIPIIYCCCGPCHTLPYRYPPTRLLAARYSLPMDFIRTSPGGPHNFSLYFLFQP